MKYYVTSEQLRWNWQYSGGPDNIQRENKQPEVLTEEHFAQAEKRELSQQLSEDDVKLIKNGLIGQPLWPQDLPDEELQQGGFQCWGEYCAWCCLKTW